MGNAITGKEYSLRKIFSSDFEYHIPAYQRPYAWGEEQTSALFDDLYQFFKSEKIDNYFLGSIVLIKAEDNARADVIDGQQRLTTLSILFSVMGDCFYKLQDYEAKMDCADLLQEKGRRTSHTLPHPRLFLRDTDQEFFNKYIQNIQIEALLKLNSSFLENEAQKHIQENAAILQQRFQDTFSSDKELLDFSDFLEKRCFLISVSTANKESAFRIFSVMNSRGLDLLPTDIIKSETIGKLPEEEQAEYTKKWEGMENKAGRDGFNEIFVHTRTIFAKERQKKNLLDEFNESVLNHVTPKALIDDYLEPYTKAYLQLKRCEYASTSHADETNQLLYWLNKTNNYDWMPPAIKFLADHPNDPDYVLWFTKKLERLASYLLVTARDVNKRVDRYKWVLVEMDNRPNGSLSDPLKNIELTEWEKEQFRNALNGEIYTMPPQRRNYIIQRLDSFVSDGGVSYNPSIFTIEHVLPQHPAPDSEWMKIWPDLEEQKHWLNRIANLVPLTRSRNSEAQNYDFPVKKDKYFRSKKGTSIFALTSQVLSVESWTPDVVKERQKELMNQFITSWDLAPSTQPETGVREYILAGRGASANGHPEGAGDAFTVLKGSRISADVTPGIPKYYLDPRQNLENDGTIQNHIFVKNHTFPNPSLAAAIVLGRSANGRREWTTLDGRSISQMGH